MNYPMNPLANHMSGSCSPQKRMQSNCTDTVSSPKFPVTADGGYPPVAVEKQDRALAQALLPFIASTRGEMTSIHEYLYQHWILTEGFDELADTLARIAEVEMRHYHMLGKLVVLLGGDPKLFTPSGNGYFPWNGGMLNYCKNVRKLLIDNAAGEQAAFDAYMAQCKRTQDAHISALLQRIAADEAVHRDIFRDYLNRLLD